MTMADIELMNDPGPLETEYYPGIWRDHFHGVGITWREARDIVEKVRKNESPFAAWRATLIIYRENK